MRTRTQGLTGLIVAALMSSGCQTGTNHRETAASRPSPTNPSLLMQTQYTALAGPGPANRSPSAISPVAAAPVVSPPIPVPSLPPVDDPVARRLATSPEPKPAREVHGPNSTPSAGSPEAVRRLATTPPPPQPPRSGAVLPRELAAFGIDGVPPGPTIPANLPTPPAPATNPSAGPTVLAGRPGSAPEPEVRKASQAPMMPPLPPTPDSGPPRPAPVYGSILTLEEAIQTTLNASPDLHSAIYRTQAADEALANARAQFFPLFTLNDSFQSSTNPLRKFTYLLSQGVLSAPALLGAPTVVANVQLQAHFQQVIYAGGQRTAAARAAEADREGSVYSLSAARNKILYQVSEAYYRLYEARELVGVRRESVGQVESQLRNVQARLRSDSAVKADELKVQARFAQVQESLANAENQYELAWSVLENVTGVHFGGRQLPEVIPPAPWSGHIDEVEVAVVEAMRQRPELGELASRKLSAEHVIRAAQGARYPNVSFFADNDVFAGRTSSQDSMTIGLALSLNLFDFGRTKSNIRQAQALAREIVAKNQRAVLDIELDVRRSALQLKDARERKAYTASAVATAEENLRLFESRYRSQSATMTELLEAQVALSDVRVGDTNAMAEIEIAQAALERAVGRFSLIGSNQPPAP